MQAFQQNFFIPAVLIGTIGFYHFIPFTVTLTLAGDNKVCAKKSLGFIFSHAFELIAMKFDKVLK